MAGRSNQGIAARLVVTEHAILAVCARQAGWGANNTA
jgi:hypothetical protein